MIETLILIQRCTFRSAVVFFRSPSSSLVNRRLQSVVRSSTVLFSRHPTVPHRRSTTTSPEVRASTSIEQVPHLSCRKLCYDTSAGLKKTTSLHPLHHWVRFLVKISYLITFTIRPSFAFWSFVSLEIINKFSP